MSLRLSIWKGKNHEQSFVPKLGDGGITLHDPAGMMAFYRQSIGKLIQVARKYSHLGKGNSAKQRFAKVRSAVTTPVRM